MWGKGRTAATAEGQRLAGCWTEAWGMVKSAGGPTH
jgi:hypothetical protein